MKTAVLVVLLTVVAIAQPCAAREFFVSPSGSSRNPGTQDSPWDLRTALSNARRIVQPGDTVVLLDGTYRGHFSVRASGSPGAPVIFKAQPLTAPRLDGNLTTTTTAAVSRRPPGERVTIRLASYEDIRPGATLYVDVPSGRAQEIVNASLEDGHVAGTRRCPIEPRGQPCPEVPAGAQVHVADAVLTIPRDVQDVWFQGLEITDSGTDSRILAAAVDDAFPLRSARRRDGVFDYGVRTRIIDCVIHDVGIGVGTWDTARGSEYSGVITFNNGYLLQGGGRAHGWYIQNDYTSPMKVFSRIISMNNFGLLGQVYSSGSVGVPIQGSVALDNAVVVATDAGSGPAINQHWLIGGGGPTRDVTVTNSVFYGRSPQFGYSSPDNENLVFRGNIFRTAPTFSKSKRVVVAGNTFAPRTSDEYLLFLRLDGTGNIPSDYTFERNTYYPPNASFPRQQFYVSPTSPQNCGYFWWNDAIEGYGYCKGTPQSWQQTLGFDTRESVYVAEGPDQPSIKVIDDPYDQFKKFVVVFNWGGAPADSIAFDVAGFGWPKGARYTVRNVADYYGDVTRGTYDGAETIQLKMTGHTVSVPYGHDRPLGVNTFPDFGVFVIDVVAPTVTGTAKHIVSIK